MKTDIFANTFIFLRITFVNVVFHLYSDQL